MKRKAEAESSTGGEEEASRAPKVAKLYHEAKEEAEAEAEHTASESELESLVARLPQPLRNEVSLYFNEPDVVRNVLQPWLCSKHFKSSCLNNGSFELRLPPEVYADPLDCFAYCRHQFPDLLEHWCKMLYDFPDAVFLTDEETGDEMGANIELSDTIIGYQPKWLPPAVQEQIHPLPVVCDGVQYYFLYAGYGRFAGIETEGQTPLDPGYGYDRVEWKNVQQELQTVVCHYALQGAPESLLFAFKLVDDEDASLAEWMQQCTNDWSEPEQVKPSLSAIGRNRRLNTLWSAVEASGKLDSVYFFDGVMYLLVPLSLTGLRRALGPYQCDSVTRNLIADYWQHRAIEIEQRVREQKGSKSYT